MIAYLKANLDFWDYIFFGSAFVMVIFFLAFLMFLLGLPGRIAVARNHPDAEAVNLMGWVGFAAVIPWINALIWAIRPADIIDIRSMPRARARETEAMIAKMKEESASIVIRKKPKGQVEISAAEPAEKPTEKPAGDAE